MKSTQSTLLSTRVFILIVLDVHSLQQFTVTEIHKNVCLLRKATCYTVLARLLRHAQAQK